MQKTQSTKWGGIPLFFISIILFSTLVYSAPPFLQDSSLSVNTNSLLIDYPKNRYFPQGANIELDFHVHNSTASLLTNLTTSCLIHIYNNVGNHIVESNLSFETNLIDFHFIVNTSISQRIGIYPYIIYCRNFNTSQAGFISSGFEVTKSGFEPNYPFQTMIFFGYLIIQFILIAFIHVFKKDRGTSMVYGVLASVISIFMGGIMLGGFEVFHGVTLIFKLDYYLIAFVFALALYTFIIANAFFSDLKKTEDE